MFVAGSRSANPKQMVTLCRQATSPRRETVASARVSVKGATSSKELKLYPDTANSGARMRRAPDRAAFSAQDARAARFSSARPCRISRCRSPMGKRSSTINLLGSFRLVKCKIRQQGLDGAVGTGPAVNPPGGRVGIPNHLDTGFRASVGNHPVAGPLQRPVGPHSRDAVPLQGHRTPVNAVEAESPGALVKQTPESANVSEKVSFRTKSSGIPS